MKVSPEKTSTAKMFSLVGEAVDKRSLDGLIGNIFQEGSICLH